MRIQRNDSKFKINAFELVKRHDYAHYTKNDNEGPRTYNIGQAKVPSVTTILAATQSEEKKAGLDKWRQRVGYQEAARITKQASIRGTEMHYVLEQYCQGKGYLNLSDEGSLPRMMAHTIVDNLGKLSEVWGTEVNLHFDNQWAGQTDLVGVYDNQPTIIDFKQSNKPKREEWIEDYYYQIAAYSLAHKLNYETINQGLICVCTKDLIYQGFLVDEEKLREYEKKWFTKVYEYHKNSKTSSPNV
jgi:hypothetical protein